MVSLVPTILTDNKEEFKKRLDNLSFSNWIQIDFMDGIFVPEKSLDLNQIPPLPNRHLEAHLMVEKPLEYLEMLKRKKFERILFHYEATRETTNEVARKIRNEGLEPVLAINPETELEEVKPYLTEFKCILFLGVTPGREGQEFQKETIEKIDFIKQISNIKIQVDGGVNKEAAKLLKGKADIVNSGSYISKSENPRKAYEELLEILK